MLRLDLGSVPEGLSHVDLSADTAEWGEPLEGGRIASPVRAQLDINRKGNDLYIRGKARVSAVLECGRCLEEYSCDIETPIEIWVTVREAEQVEERENVIEVSAGAGYADLTDYVRSDLLVQLPLKQVCRVGCKGLCPVCGTNLNLTTCSCERHDHDSRWDALKRLKGKP